MASIGLIRPDSSGGHERTSIAIEEMLLAVREFFRDSPSAFSGGVIVGLAGALVGVQLGILGGMVGVLAGIVLGRVIGKALDARSRRVDRNLLSGS